MLPLVGGFHELGQPGRCELPSAARFSLQRYKIIEPWHFNDIISFPIIEDGIDEPGAEKGDERGCAFYLFDGWMRCVYDAFIEARGAVYFGCFAFDANILIVVLYDPYEGWQPNRRVMVFDGEPDVVREETVMGKLVSKSMHIIMITFHFDEMNSGRKTWFQVFLCLLKLLISLTLLATACGRRVLSMTVMICGFVIPAGSHDRVYLVL
jgi:hypothetical protein